MKIQSYDYVNQTKKEINRLNVEIQQYEDSCEVLKSESRKWHSEDLKHAVRAFVLESKQQLIDAFMISNIGRAGFVEVNHRDNILFARFRNGNGFLAFFVDEYNKIPVWLQKSIWKAAINENKTECNFEDFVKTDFIKLVESKSNLDWIRKSSAFINHSQDEYHNYTALIYASEEFNVRPTIIIHHDCY